MRGLLLLLLRNIVLEYLSRGREGKGRGGGSFGVVVVVVERVDG